MTLGTTLSPLLYILGDLRVQSPPTSKIACVWDVTWSNSEDLRINKSPFSYDSYLLSRRADNMESSELPPPKMYETGRILQIRQYALGEDLYVNSYGRNWEGGVYGRPW